MADTISGLKRMLMESPPGEWLFNQLRELLIGALKQGPVPQHVAFEMDGNRRYARSKRMETVEGHHHGFEALARIMEICYKCGVKVVTVYAFSIENYKRPKYEVEGLMQLAKVKLEQLTTYGDILDRYGASVRILGQREMIQDDVLEVMDRAVARTKHNKKAVLNICFPYTSRAEMTTAIKSTVAEFMTSPPPKSTPFSPSRIRQNILSRQLDGREPLPTIRDESPEGSNSEGDGEKDTNDGADSSSATLPPGSPEGSKSEGDGEKDTNDGADSSSATLPPDSPPQRSGARNGSLDSASLPNPESITVETIDKHTYTAQDPPLDLFVRTSGVERLSDFMLWQCHQDTHIFFLDCLWPDFDLHHFVWVLLEWQWRQKQADREEAPLKRRNSKPRTRVAE